MSTRRTRSQSARGRSTAPADVIPPAPIAPANIIAPANNSNAVAINASQPIAPLASNGHVDRLAIARFTGQGNNVRAAAWINMYELMTEGKDDRERIKMLLRFIEGDTINWYSDDIIPSIASLTWAKVKQLFIDRFGLIRISPIIDAQARFLRNTEDVQQYYTDKMYLMRQTGLSELEHVQMLTHGMPLEYQKHLIGTHIKTTSEWLTTALRLEVSTLRRPMFQPRQNNQHPRSLATVNQKGRNDKPQYNKQDKPRTSRKPPKPCQHCAKEGDVDQWHWHNECPRRAATAPKETAAITMTCNSLN